MSNGTLPGISLYVHVPYCVSKCAYCDFASTVADSGSQEAFLTRLRAELACWAAPGLPLAQPLSSVYIGGGTPTLLGPALVELVEHMRCELEFVEAAEVTVETNPDTTDAELVRRLVAAGVNRFSVGIQSFDDRVLRYLGRCHSARRGREALSILCDADVAFSADLICGVPVGSRDWSGEVEQVVASGAGHVSVYPLSIEERTPLGAAIERGEAAAPDPDEAAREMLEAAGILSSAGYHRYEIANYARAGQESRHNLGYWRGQPFVGLGPSAAGMLDAEAFRVVVESMGWAAQLEELPIDGRVRIVSTESPYGWLAAAACSAPEMVESLSPAEALREDVMLGLRLTEGVSAEQAERAGVDGVLRVLAAEGLVERHPEPDGSWRLTERGWLLGNEVFSRVWHGE